MRWQFSFIHHNKDRLIRILKNIIEKTIRFMFYCMAFILTYFSPISETNLDYLTPEGLLKVLSAPINKEPGMITLRNQKENWVGPKDVVKLIKLLDSDTPCASVGMAYSSKLSRLSTISNEASYMIIGYFRSVYPPGLNSTDTGFGKEHALKLIEESLENYKIKHSDK